MFDSIKLDKLNYVWQAIKFAKASCIKWQVCISLFNIFSTHNSTLSYLPFVVFALFSLFSENGGCRGLGWVLFLFQGDKILLPKVPLSFLQQLLCFWRWWGLPRLGHENCPGWVMRMSVAYCHVHFQLCSNSNKFLWHFGQLIYNFFQKMCEEDIDNSSEEFYYLQ